MPSDQTDISKLPLAGGNTSAPSSGTYGEGAALARLKQQLPVVEQSAQEPGQSAAPMPTPPMGGGISNSPPTGLPPGILAPTNRPDTPVSTPLGQPTNPLAAQTGRQRRIAVLDALANDPNVSDQTREWAQINLRALVSQ